MVLEKNKLAFVLPNLNAGGAERVVSSLANELCKKYDIILITLSAGDSYYYLDPRIQHIKCSTRSISSSNSFQAVYNNYLLIQKLTSILKNFKSDLIIGFTTTANILALIASRQLNRPCIISERSNPYIYKPNKFWSLLRKLTYKNADYIMKNGILIGCQISGILSSL